MSFKFLPAFRTLLCIGAFALFSANSQAQYCTPAPAFGCALGDYFSQFELIGTTMNISDPSISCGSGYEDRTAETCAVASPSTVNGTITAAAFSISGEIGNMQIYVDWNNNGTFAAGESVGGIDPVSSSPTPFSIAIPSGIATGDYRMRVVYAAESDATYPGISPCLYTDVFFTIFPYFYGNAVDYTIHVGPSVPTCPAPTVTLGAATCSTQVINWTAAAGATGYEYIRNTTAGSPASGTAIAATPTTTTETGLAAGTTYYAHIRTNCGGGSYSAWVNTPFTVTGPGPIGGNAALCPGSTTPLSNSVGGGTWTSSNPAAATVNPTTGLMGGVAVGTTTITYTVGVCTATLAVTVGNLPAIAGIPNVCPTGTTQLSNAVPGGTWSSSNMTVATVGATTGLVTGGTPGTAVITYTNSGCSNTITVTVSNLPAITGGNSVCIGSTVNLSNSLAGGVWSSNAPSVATVTATGVVTGVLSGSATIVYSLGTCTVSQAVLVDAAIMPITGTATFCVTGSSTLASGTGGGTWSSSNPAVATVTTAGVAKGVSAGSATISYTRGGCSATLAITIDANNGGTITGADTLCKGPSHEANLTASVPGGVWSSSNTARATVDPATGVVTGVASSQSFIIRYVVTNTCGTYTVTHPMYVRSAAKCATGIEPAEGGVITDLKVFPNPNSGTFMVNLSSPENEGVYITITNIVGAKVKEYTTTTNTKTDLQLQVPPGIYMISAATTQGRYVKKIVIGQ